MLKLVRSCSTDSLFLNLFVPGERTGLFNFGNIFTLASKNSELRRLLKKHGWILVKAGSKHDVYRKNGKSLLMPRGDNIYSRSYKQIRWQIEGRTDKSKVDLFSLHTESESQSSLPRRYVESIHESLTDA